MFKYKVLRSQLLIFCYSIEMSNLIKNNNNKQTNKYLYYIKTVQLAKEKKLSLAVNKINNNIS